VCDKSFIVKKYKHAEYVISVTLSIGNGHESHPVLAALLQLFIERSSIKKYSMLKQGVILRPFPVVYFIGEFKKEMSRKLK